MWLPPAGLHRTLCAILRGVLKAFPAINITNLGSEIPESDCLQVFYSGQSARLFELGRPPPSTYLWRRIPQAIRRWTEATTSIFWDIYQAPALVINHAHLKYNKQLYMRTHIARDGRQATEARIANRESDLYFPNTGTELPCSRYPWTVF